MEVFIPKIKRENYNSSLTLRGCLFIRREQRRRLEGREMRWFCSQPKQNNDCSSDSGEPWRLGSAGVGPGLCTPAVAGQGRGRGR